MPRRSWWRDAVMLASPIVLLGGAWWGLQEKERRDRAREEAARAARAAAAIAAVEAAEEAILSNPSEAPLYRTRLKPRTLGASDYNRVRSLVWSRNGRRLAARKHIARGGEQVQVWDVPRGSLAWRRSLRRSFPNGLAHLEFGNEIQFFSSGKTLAVTAQKLDRDLVEARLFDAGTGQPRPMARDQRGSSFLSGERLYSIPSPYVQPSPDRAPRTFVWDALTGRKLGEVEAYLPPSWIEAARDPMVTVFAPSIFGPRGQWGIFGMDDSRPNVPGGFPINTMAIFNTRQPRQMKIVSGVMMYQASQRGDLLAFDIVRVSKGIGVRKIATQIWDMETGILQATLKPPVSQARSSYMASPYLFSPDSSKMLMQDFSGHAARRLSLWDTASGKLLWSRKHRLGGTAQGYSKSSVLAMSPDASLIAHVDWRTILLRDARSGRLLRRLTEHRGEVFLRRFAGHRGEVFALAFSPDGKTLASGANDGAVKLWRVR